MSHEKSSEAGHGMSVEDRRRRRALLKSAVLGGGAAVASFFRSPTARAAEPSQKEQNAQAVVDRATRGMPAPKIVDIQVIKPLTVVKVITDQPGLYGYGDAVLISRNSSVEMAVEQYMKPMLIGKPTSNIEEIWQLLYFSSYYKNDHTQNSAIGGICDALWDIKGRQVGLPVYQLVGGRAREAAVGYMHVGAGLDPKKVVENSKKLVAEGALNLQIDLFARDSMGKTVSGAEAYDSDLAMRLMYKAFEAFRKEIPENVKLGVDVHSMLNGMQAVKFCKDVDRFGPWYWVEDPVSPEEQDHLKVIRQQSTVPLSIGELYNNPHEWKQLMVDRLVDYTRIHVPHIGGFTAARKVAAFAEGFEVKTGWHGGVLTPVGNAVRATLDITSNNFGIHEVFPGGGPRGIYQGAPEVKNGYIYVSEKPGWGVEIDEAAAAKMKPGNDSGREHRAPDGGVVGATG